VFALGVALAGIAGVIMAPIWGMRPHVGVDAVVPAFLIIVLGGVGSFWGAVVAALLVGLVVGLTGAYASEWSLLSMYLLFIAVVTFRARGFFGKKSVLDV
jgi:branched-chain amino acid transport system permease protein